MVNPRRRRFLQFVEERYNNRRAKLIEDTGLTKGRVAQLFDEDEPFGETAGRNLALKLGLSETYFESDQDGSAELPRAPTGVAVAGIDVELNHFETGGAMGSGLLLRDQPGVIQSWRVTREWVEKNVRSYTATSNLCIVTGFGDSMRPLFNPGDPLLVDVGVRSVEYDAIYFFRVEEEGFIKRLQRIPGEGLRVLSANRDNYEPWTVKPEMDFEVLGRVLKVWRGEDF